MRITRQSVAISIIGAVFAIVAFILPGSVHIEAVVPPGSVSSPEKSLIIVKWCCALDGLWCLYLGLSGWRWRRLAADSLIVPSDPGQLFVYAKASDCRATFHNFSGNGAAKSISRLEFLA